MIETDRNIDNFFIIITIFSEFDPDSITALDSCFRVVSSTTHTAAFFLRSLNFPTHVIGYIPAEGRIKIVEEANIGSALIKWYLKGKVSSYTETTHIRFASLNVDGHDDDLFMWQHTLL